MIDTRDLDTEVSQIKARHAAATRARARAEQQQLAAQATADAARAQLNAQFGIDTAEQARTVLAELNTELATNIAKLQALLDEAGA